MEWKYIYMNRTGRKEQGMNELKGRECVHVCMYVCMYPNTESLISLSPRTPEHLRYCGGARFRNEQVYGARNCDTCWPEDHVHTRIIGYGVSGFSVLLGLWSRLVRGRDSPNMRVPNVMQCCVSGTWCTHLSKTPQAPRAPSTSSSLRTLCRKPF